jgi:hypothetical protein
MSRHASAEVLASLDLGGLKSRKAAKIRAHVAVCVHCTELSRQVAAVPHMLASVPYPVMPQQLSVRIESLIATESAQRVASAPASEAGRRDLPERSRHAREARGGWRMPGMSVLATRLVAAAGALVIVGAGGYEIATHAGGNVAGTAASTSGSVAAPSARTPQMSLGPDVRYGEPTATRTIRTVRSDTNFTSANLGAQALAAVHAAKLSETAGGGATTIPGPSGQANTTKNSSAAGAGSSAESASQLAGCLDSVAGNQTVVLVEQAMYEGKQATIIVTAQTATREGEVWAVGPGCSASNPDVLNHLRLART